MLKSITVSKLFGKFNYRLDFPDTGIMIITGPNGYGKSTILKIINALCSNDLETILRLPFTECSINSISKEFVFKTGDKDFSINGISLQYPNEENAKETKYAIRHSRINEITILRQLREHINMEFEDLSTKTAIELQDNPYSVALVSWNLRDVVTSNEDMIREVMKRVTKVYCTLQELSNEIGSVYFIKEQRLIERKNIEEDNRGYGREKEEYVPVINENSEMMKTALANVMKKHSSISSDLDGSFVKRLFDLKSYEEIAPTDIHNKLGELQARQEKLQKYGLADEQKVSYISNVVDDEKIKQFIKELSIYIQDTNKKYKVFEDIINRIELYEDIVNSKLMYKKMKISIEKGISIITEDSKELPLTCLSSGEQEILVLFYKLIFESNVNLLLIDEPEISLHIVWQRAILDDIKKIKKINNNMQVIIATHSPQIISDNWNLQIDLGGLANG